MKLSLQTHLRHSQLEIDKTVRAVKTSLLQKTLILCVSYCLPTHSASSNKLAEKLFYGSVLLVIFLIIIHSKSDSIKGSPDVFSAFNHSLETGHFHKHFQNSNCVLNFFFFQSHLVSSSPFNYRANFQPTVYESLLISYSSFRAQQSCEYRKKLTSVLL